MPEHVVPAHKRSFAKQLRRHQSAAEDLLWRELRDRRLGGWKFRRQVPIEGYIADFVCFEARLIVEVDGPVHRHPEQRLKDAERNAVLRRHGFRVIRFESEAALGRVIEDIRRVLASPSPGP
jgi:very-short-patch-repair endonuclease